MSEEKGRYSGWLQAVVPVLSGAAAGIVILMVGIEVNKERLDHVVELMGQLDTRIEKRVTKLEDKRVSPGTDIRLTRLETARTAWERRLVSLELSVIDGTMCTRAYCDRLQKRVDGIAAIQSEGLPVFSTLQYRIDELEKLTKGRK